MTCKKVSALRTRMPVRIAAFGEELAVKKRVKEDTGFCTGSFTWKGNGRGCGLHTLSVLHVCMCVCTVSS